MPKRILFICDDLFELSEVSLLQPLAAALQQAGHTIRVLALEASDDDLQRWRGLGLDVVALQASDSPASSWRARWARQQSLLEHLRTFEPEIVHDWGPRSHRPVQWALGSLGGSQRSSIGHWHSRFTLEQPGQARPSWLSGRPADRMFTSHSRIEPAASPSATVIAPGVPQTIATPEVRDQVRHQLGLRPTDFLAVAVAPLVPATRLKDLVWATDLLVCIRDDVHLAILGRGPQQARLRRFANQTEAGQHIHLLGQPPESMQILMAADVFWHSHVGTPLPIPQLLAMEAGIPAVAALGPGTDSLIDHQVTGLAVNYGARDEFARWTKYLIEQQASAQQLARQGQDHVRHHFPQSTMLEAYLEQFAD